jgi:hypothetical protein
MVIIEPQYFPPISVLRELIVYKEIGFVLDEKYKKMSFRNRCIVSGANGIISLSIPIKGGREVNQFMRHVEIDNTVDWQTQHWRTLRSIYARSPWFEYYAPQLELFYAKKYIFLYQWNFDLLNWVFKVLKLDIKINQIEFDSILESDNILTDKIMPKNYLEQFENFVPKYQQVFQEKTGFIPNMSILDLIFCEGANGVNYLNI